MIHKASMTTYTELTKEELVIILSDSSIPDDAKVEISSHDDQRDGYSATITFKWNS